MTPASGVNPLQNVAGPLLAALRAGDVSAAEATDDRLDALHAVHEQSGAVVFFDDERALVAARALDERFAAGGPVGPLHGLPITVKDWIDVEGLPCAGESTDLDRRPDRDATVVARLRAAGAVVLAKTAIAGGPFDRRVHHPERPDRSVGVSSSGEAVVVSTGASPLGIGSDSGGSVRLPAAWAGVFGLKPSAGRVPTTGHFPRVGAMSDGRTQIGPLARDLDTIELVLQLVNGTDGRDGGVAPVPLGRSSAVDVAALRFAVVLGDDRWAPSTSIADAVECAARALEDAGASRRDWSGRWLGDAMDVTLRYWSRRERTGAQVAGDLWDWDRFRRDYLRSVEHVDVLVTPATADVAPLARSITGDDYVYTLPASLTGSPALVVPAGADPHGLPRSVQIVGRPWEDPVVLAAGRVIASAF